MSHISKGLVKVSMKNKDLLIKTLMHFGKVAENDIIYAYQGNGRYTTDNKKYDLVLINEKHPKQRIGFNIVNNIDYEPFYDNYGELGTWINGIKMKIEDRYIAHHYEKELMEEGFNVVITEAANGAYEVEALEEVW